MNKKDFKALSTVKCSRAGCNKFLKQNLIDKNPNAEYCYKHDQLLKGKVKFKPVEVTEGELS